MQRPIVGWDRDDLGDWVALLGCGHRQHVRHRPPFQERAWVEDAAGREARLGTPLECRLCDEEAATEPPGGDPACWVDLVCPSCGAIGPHRAGCAAAGGAGC